MAERVQKSLESTLPELEELEKVGIFSREEIRWIVRKRRRLEYRLLRRPARVADYLRAIQYEVNLDLLRKHRKRVYGVDSKVCDAERGITARLHQLFKRALKKFKGNIRLWLQYIEFCKHVNHYHTLGKLYGRVLALHPRNSGLWVMAAKHQLDEEKNPSGARALLQQAIRTNGDCKHLWLEYFKLELLHVDQMVKRQTLLGLDVTDDNEILSDDFMANKTALMVYKAATSAVPSDVEFCLSFLPVTKLFTNTEYLQEQIWSNVKENFPDEPVMWDAVARRQWDNMDVSFLTEEQVIQMEEEAMTIFKEAVARIPTADMYDKMINWCQGRLQNSPFPALSAARQQTALQRLQEALQMAVDKDCMTLDSYKLYVTVLLDKGKMSETIQLCETVSQKYPECVEVWQLRLASPIATDKEKESWLEEAIKSTTNEERLLRLWQLYLSWSSGRQEDTMTSLFERAVTSTVGPAKDQLLMDYIDWLLVAMGIEDVRALYPRIIGDRPVALTVCNKCIEIEENQTSADMKMIRQLYEAALSDHGTNDIRTWLRYMKCESSLPGGDLSSVGKLYWRAVKTLSPELVATFISEHTLQHNSTT